VVVGAGFGGLEVARRLQRIDVDVTLIDQRNHHTFQPLLYQVATAGLDTDDICHSTRGILRKHPNARSVQATVVDVDFDGQLVRTLDGGSISYDTLVLALGAVTADFGVPGVAEHAFGLKSGAEALHIRNHVLRNFERAARSRDQAEQQAATTVVIVGGGPTGVEMAGGFAELFDKVLRRDFPELASTPPRVVLVEGQDRLLASFSPRLAATAEVRLGQMGVVVQTSTQVAAVNAASVELNSGEVIAASTVVWAAGVKAHPLAEAWGLETSRAGRVVVDAQLRVPGRSNVFVIGDLAAAHTSNGDLIPQVAPGAIQAGAYVAGLIAGTADSNAQFHYQDKGSMATIGRNAAVVELPSGRTVTGFAGWVAWLALHLVMLVGFRNRANVMVNWAWNYLTWDRGSRVIIDLDEDGAQNTNRVSD